MQFPNAIAALGLAIGFITSGQNVQAQSSLGLNFAEAGFGLSAGQADTSISGFALGDYRITPQHGIQVDLSIADRPGGFVGQLDGHLYLSPQPDRKYGFVLSLADADSREATMAAGGIEGMIALRGDLFLSGQALLGYARPDDVDFIAISGTLQKALNDNVSLFATLDLAEFDEEALRANAWSGRIGVTFQPDAAGFEWLAAVAGDGLTGRDSKDPEARLEIGVTWRFGAAGGARRPVSERAFRVMQPFDPLLRRGLF
jgi:hypothetical protein